MTAVYIDTSVLGPYYTPEARSEDAEAQLRAIADPVISELTEVEMRSLIAKKHRMGELDEAEARRVLMQFQDHVSAGLFRRLNLNTAHFGQTCRFLDRLTTRLRTLDALHLSIASESNLSLLTDDTVLAEAAATFGIDCQRL